MTVYMLNWLLSVLIFEWNSTPATDGRIAVSHNDEPRRVAIIGAGIAASSFVSRLLDHNTSDSIHVTVFEKEAAVGGRIKSIVHNFGEFGALEGGADYFTADDRCLLDLIDRAGLQDGDKVPGLRLSPSGYGFPFRSPVTFRGRCNAETTEWREIRDLLWSYGTSFWRARRSVQSTRSKWQGFLSRDNSSENLGSALKGAGIDDSLLAPAHKYVRQKHISELYQHDVLRPCTRSRTYKHSQEVTTLDSLLAARTLTNTGVAGGNVQIVERMLLQGPVKLLYNSHVERISPGQHRAFSVAYSVPSASLQSEFDFVIIAAPLSVSNITLDIPRLWSLESTFIPYESRHVTYLSTRQPISSGSAYGYLDVADLVDGILTTSRMEEVNIDAIKITQKCEVFPCPPGDELDCDDCGYVNIFRIVSRGYLSDAALIDLIEPVLGCEEDANMNLTRRRDCSDISWIHRFAWPQALPK